MKVYRILAEYPGLYVVQQHCGWWIFKSWITLTWGAFPPKKYFTLAEAREKLEGQKRYDSFVPYVVKDTE